MSQEKGLLALFDSPSKLLEAVAKVRALQIAKIESFTPFPVHGIEKAMGLKPSFIPWLTLIFALTGAVLLFAFQTWTSAFDWPLNVGGKPLISWPAFIPITFEGAILFGGVLSFFTFFAIIRLPNYSKPVLDERITNDLFGLYIDETDPLFDKEKLNAVFKECQVKEVKTIV